MRSQIMQVGVSQTAFILQNHLLCNAFRDARRRADVVIRKVVVFIIVDVFLRIVVVFVRIVDVFDICKVVSAFWTSYHCTLFSVFRCAALFLLWGEPFCGFFKTV